jgi:hypothetical protein
MSLTFGQLSGSPNEKIYRLSLDKLAASFAKRYSADLNWAEDAST